MGVKRTFLLLCSFFLFGCRTPSFPPVNLSTPSWQTRTGQAIWKPDRTKPEIVGDLVISSDQNGNAYLEFSKAFPIVHAWLSPEGWQIEYPPQHKHYAAPGKPPGRISWLQFLRAATGFQVAPGWKISARDESAITLSNLTTGELIEAHF